MDRPQLIKIAEEIYKSNLDVSNHPEDAFDITMHTLQHMGIAGDLETGEYTFLTDYLQKYKQ